jgi:hypothetical protein
MTTAYFNNNFLTSLNGRLFANNHEIIVISSSNNQINAIGREFLNGLPHVALVDLTGNVCANRYWLIGGPITINQVIADLETCFRNVVEPPTTTPLPEPDNELRRFVLELRGPLSLRFENGTQIVTV